MVNNEHPRKEEVVELKDGLVEHLAQLKELSQNYQSNLDESLLARQVHIFVCFCLFSVWFSWLCQTICR